MGRMMSLLSTASEKVNTVIIDSHCHGFGGCPACQYVRRNAACVATADTRRGVVKGVLEAFILLAPVWSGRL